jgi:hypothetical protein
VIETLTAGRMIPPGTNSAPAEESKPVIETLTAGRMIHSGTNGPPEVNIHAIVSVSITGSILLLVDY